MIHFDKPEHDIALVNVKVEKSGRLAGRIASRNLGKEHTGQISSFERVVRINGRQRSANQLKANQ